MTATYMGACSQTSCLNRLDAPPAPGPFSCTAREPHELPRIGDKREQCCRNNSGSLSTGLRQMPEIERRRMEAFWCIRKTKLQPKQKHWFHPSTRFLPSLLLHLELLRCWRLCHLSWSESQGYTLQQFASLWQGQPFPLTFTPTVANEPVVHVFVNVAPNHGRNSQWFYIIYGSLNKCSIFCWGRSISDMSLHDKETTGAGNVVHIGQDSFSDKDVGLQMVKITAHETDVYNSGT